jgi:hypothetical protein
MSSYKNPCFHAMIRTSADDSRLTAALSTHLLGCGAHTPFRLKTCMLQLPTAGFKCTCRWHCKTRSGHVAQCSRDRRNCRSSSTVMSCIGCLDGGLMRRALPRNPVIGSEWTLNTDCSTYRPRGLSRIDESRTVSRAAHLARELGRQRCCRERFSGRCCANFRSSWAVCVRDR